MTKGISAVISVVLLLLVAIGLIFAVYTWVTGTTSSGMSAGSQKMGQTIKTLQTDFIIESVKCSGTTVTVYLYNSGKYAIDLSKISVYFKGVPQTLSGATGTLDVDDRAQVSFTVSGCTPDVCNQEVKVVYQGVERTATITC